MSADVSNPIQDLLQRRLMLVSTISALTAKMHRLIQEHSGAEMEILRLELASGRSPADGELLHALARAEADAETIRSRQEDCAAEIEVAEAAVSEVDRLIAASKEKQ